jgi:hypothetical protein
MMTTIMTRFEYLRSLTDAQLEAELRHLTLAWVESGYEDSREGFATYRQLLYCRAECRDRGLEELVLEVKRDAVAEIRERRRPLT